MVKKTQLLNKKEILSNLSTEDKESLEELIIFKEIGSTNDEAKKKISKIKDTTSSLAFFAEKQIMGRGRSGKSWESPKNVNIYLSFAWLTTMPPKELEGLSLSVAVEIVNALNPILLNDTLKIKWPNDLFLSDQKVGGILVESSIDKNKTGIVIGVGFNVLMSGKQNSIDQNWTSLSLYFQKDFDRNQIAGLILKSLFNLKQNFEKHGFSFYKEQFDSLNLLKNKRCLVTLAGQDLKGVVEGVKENGELIFREKDKIHYLRFGEVSIKNI